MRLTFFKLASLLLLGAATWFTTRAIVSRAGKVDDFEIQTRSDEIRVGFGVPYDGFVEPVKFVPKPWDVQTAEISGVSANGEGAFTHITGSATLFTRKPGTKYFWAVKVTSGDGTSEDIIFDDTLAALPEGQVVEPSIDKFLPLDSGDYDLRFRVQLVPPSLADGGLDNPILRKQCGAVEATCRVSVN